MSVRNIISSGDSTKAILEVPRLSTVQKNALASPYVGNLVYDVTDNNLSYYDGTNWASVTGSTGGPSGNGVCSFNLVASENFTAGSSFPLGSLNPTNFASTFSTFPSPVTVTSGLFTLPASGVYRICVSCHVSIATNPTNGTLIFKLVNGANTTTYSIQYPTCVSTAFPTDFNYNFEFVGQFASGNTVQCLVQNTSSTGAFTAESVNNGTVVSFEKVA